MVRLLVISLILLSINCLPKKIDVSSSQPLAKADIKAKAEVQVGNKNRVGGNQGITSEDVKAIVIWGFAIYFITSKIHDWILLLIQMKVGLKKDLNRVPLYKLEGEINRRKEKGK